MAYPESRESRESPEWERRKSIGGGSEKISDTTSERLPQWTDEEGKPSGVSKQSERYCQNVSNYHGQRFKEQYNGITERARDFNGCDAGRKAEHSGWSTEPAVGGCFDGVSTGLDSVRCLTYFSHLSIMAYVKSIYGEINGKTKRDRAGEILRTVRDGIEKEEVQWQVGGFDSVQEKKILLSFLCELQEASEELDNISFKGKETFEREMRELRMEFFLTSASYRPRLQEQREREHPDSLQALSRLLAHDCKKDWERNSRENARIKYGWEQNIPRLITKLPNRVDRLKGLGNAIVPQIAELLFKQIS